jgi:hypothetical protein
VNEIDHARVAKIAVDYLHHGSPWFLLTMGLALAASLGRRASPRCRIKRSPAPDMAVIEHDQIHAADIVAQR